MFRLFFSLYTNMTADFFFLLSLLSHYGLLERKVPYVHDPESTESDLVVVPLLPWRFMCMGFIRSLFQKIKFHSLGHEEEKV